MTQRPERNREREKVTNKRDIQEQFRRRPPTAQFPYTTDMTKESVCISSSYEGECERGYMYVACGESRSKK